MWSLLCRGTSDGDTCIYSDRSTIYIPAPVAAAAGTYAEAAALSTVKSVFRMW